VTFNAEVPDATGGNVGAAPLLFNNAGSTVAWFRTMVDEGLVDFTVAQLAETAAESGSVI